MKFVADKSMKYYSLIVLPNILACEKVLYKIKIS